VLPEDVDVTQQIDALVVSPVDDHQRRSAALTACEVMGRTGRSAEEIRDVLAALDLLRHA
jgi:hypothetical protein